MMKTLQTTTIALCSLACASLAHAQFFVGLNTGGLSLTTFGASGVSSPTTPITGLTLGDSIIDIDFFPVDGRLFGMGTSGTLYTITLGGAATINAGPVYTAMAPGTTTSIGMPTAIDFNPMADRLRVYSGTANFRITPTSGILSDDGQLAYIDGTPGTPNLVAAAYINNFDGAASTTLYSIDATTNSLVVNSSDPNLPGTFSQLRTQDVLTLMGVTIDFLAANTGFDVLTMGSANTAYVSSGNTIYTVTLNMGMVGTAAGDLTLFTTVTGPGAGITDFAVAIPEPSTYALLCVGLVGIGLFAFRRARVRA